MKDFKKRDLENVIADEIIRVSATINTSFSLNKDKVVEIVSKAIPKKVAVPDDYIFHCPNCGADSFSLMYDFNIKESYNYCCNCGQKLDWSDIVND